MKRNLQIASVEVLGANVMAIKHIKENRRCGMEELYDILGDNIELYAPDIVGVSCLIHSIAFSAHGNQRFRGNHYGNGRQGKGRSPIC